MVRSARPDVRPDDAVVLEVERKRVRRRHGCGAGADLAADRDVVQAHPVDAGGPGVGPVDPARFLVDHDAVAELRWTPAGGGFRSRRGLLSLRNSCLSVPSRFADQMPPASVEGPGVHPVDASPHGVDRGRRRGVEQLRTGDQVRAVTATIEIRAGESGVPDRRDRFLRGHPVGGLLGLVDLDFEGVVGLRRWVESGQVIRGDLDRRLTGEAGFGGEREARHRGRR